MEIHQEMKQLGDNLNTVKDMIEEAIKPLKDEIERLKNHCHPMYSASSSTGKPYPEE